MASEIKKIDAEIALLQNDPQQAIDAARLNERKTVIEATLARLKSKAGAEAFVAERLAAIDQALPKLSASMAWQCGHVKKQLKERPADYVEKVKAILQVERVSVVEMLAKKTLAKGDKDAY